MQFEGVYFKEAFSAEVYFVCFEYAKVDLAALLGNSHADIHQAEQDIQQIRIFEHLI